MAATVIGLDVGTNAVRAVELELGDVPEIRRMGQVGLPVGAVVDGEVADVAAVSLALRRLWDSVGFKGKKVRVGMSSARVIVRTIEMPHLSHDELMSTIRLQLDDFVPLPPDETIFDIRSIDGAETTGKTQQLLLAATHHDAVEPLVMALNGADLKVEAVDVIPAALAAAFTRPEPDQDDRVDVLLSVGAGTVVVVAARGGEALYSRTVTHVGGLQITENIASRLAIGAGEAERDKRLGATINPTSAATMLAAAPSIEELITEVRASLSFYAEQTPTRAVRRVLITGGGSLLVGLISALSNDLGLEVIPADPFANVRLGPHTGFDESDLPYIAPYMAAALGVAVRAGRPKDRRIDLSPTNLRSSGPQVSRKLLIRVGAVVLVGAGGAFYMHGRSAIADEQAKLATAQVQLTDVQARAAAQAPVVAGPAAAPTGGASPDVVATSVASSNIDWLAVEAAVNEGTAPLGVIVSSFQGAFVAPPTPAAVAVDPAAAPVATPETVPITSSVGTLTLSATAPGLLAVADWLDSIAADPRFAEPWASGLTVVTQPDGSSVVQFTMAMTVTDTNLVNRTATAGAAG
jgi:type IV pilus assembly protein PilM